MAYDKIIVIHARLDKRIDYALNEAKTMRQENGQILQTAINCQLDTAYQDMRMTKRRWDKEKRPIQGYHVIHSFAPGEVSPEQAQEIGMELARRLVGDRFEAVVSTHTDHAHVHCHIVCIPLFLCLSSLGTALRRRSYLLFFPTPGRQRQHGGKCCSDYSFSQYYNLP